MAGAVERAAAHIDVATIGSDVADAADGVARAGVARVYDDIKRVAGSAADGIPRERDFPAADRVKVSVLALVLSLHAPPRVMLPPDSMVMLPVLRYVEIRIGDDVARSAAADDQRQLW